MKKEFGIIGLFILIDQIVKLFAMHITNPITIIPNFLQLIYVQNFGVAWSMFNNKMLLIIAFSAVAICYLIYILRQYRTHLIIHFGILMMLGGAIGNVLDRLIRGFVVDYIDVVIFGYDFPVFNIADMLLVCGVILIFVETLRKAKNGETI